AARPKPWMRVSPSATAPSRTARCELPLFPGTPTAPTNAAAGSILIEHRRDDDAVALALQELGRSLCLAFAADEHLERAAAFRRHVVELEVLYCDALGPERLRDRGEHAGAVGDVHTEALQRARVGVLALEHAASVRRRFADPAREKACVPLIEGGLDLLD